jgi:hypothetical protein
MDKTIGVVEVSFSAKIDLAKVSKKRLCKLGSLLSGKLMPEGDKKELLSILSTEIGDPRRITNSLITKVLNDEGYEIGISTVERHRLELCCCFRGGR